jgi:hypothetical protein
MAGKTRMKKGSTQALKRSIASLKREVNSTPVIKQIRGNPKPVIKNFGTYVNKTIQIRKVSSAGAGSTNVQDILSEFAYTPFDLRVDWVKVWNTNGRMVKVTFLTEHFCMGITGMGDSVGEDFGTSSHLPGVGLDVPMTITTDVTKLSASTNLVSWLCDGPTDAICIQYGIRLKV